MKRVFISYRSSDGKKDASRLAEDLAEVFGDAAVFYDKHNLHGGSSWRQQVQQALGERPVVLVLLTPDYFGAREDGELRIHRIDDPVRQELLAAFDAQATLLPLLTEGVTMPRPAALPADLARVTEAHALKLRTEDWRTDLARLVKDLRALGMVALAKPQPQPPTDDPAHGPAPGQAASGYQSLAWAAGLAGALAAFAQQAQADHEAALGFAVLSLGPLWLAWRGRALLKGLPGKTPAACAWGTLAWCGLIGLGLLGQVGGTAPLEASSDPAPPVATRPATALPASPPPPAPAAPTAAVQDNLTGTWLATLSNGLQLPLTLLHRGEQVLVTTTKIDVRNDASFAPMNQHLARTQGFMVTDVRVRGQGRLQGDLVELALQMTDGDGQRLLDQGNMTLAVGDAGRTLSGSLHFASGTPTPIRLARQ